MKVSVVSPFYNEENIIVSSTKRMMNNLTHQFSDWELILVNDGSQDNSLQKILDSEDLKNKNLRIVDLTSKAFKAISYRDRPDGMISLFKVKTQNIDSKDLSGPILIADSIEKPGNLGTMIRTARSFDITNIISSDGVTDFFNPNVIRSSIGHIFNINIFSEKSKKIISYLQRLNYEIISLDPDSANSIKSYKPKKNYALVIGSEQYGISEIWKDNASQILKIDTENKVDSLNASGAAAIAMWEFYKNYE